MENKTKTLTNEDLAKKFTSNFELVSYAIKLAENMIKTGRDARVKSEVQNRAMLVLEEISEGKDQFDQITETTSFAQGDHASIETEEIFKTRSIMEDKPTDRRRSKVALVDEE
jgi:hypothetical protein